MNRYTQLSFNQLDPGLMQLPYEQLDQLLASQQQQIDTTNQLMLAKPRYIEQSKGDVQLAGKINKWQSEVQKQITEIAKTGNVSDYLSALKQAQNEMVKLYSPGGAGHALETRYAAFQKEKEKITEATSKYKNPLYRPHFEEQFLKQLEDQDIYNQNTRTAKAIQPANIFAEVNVGEEIDKYFKDWAKTKKVDIGKWTDSSGKVNPYYFEKYSVEGISKEELQDALNNFYQKPEIQQALSVEASSIKRNLTPGQQIGVVEAAQEARNLKLENAIVEQTAILNAYEKKKNSDEVKNIVELAGFKTFDEYKTNILKSFDDAREFIKSNPLTIDGVIADSIKSKYTDTYVPKYAATKEDRDLIVNRSAIEALRHQNKLSENKNLVSQLEALYKNPNSIFAQSELDAIKQTSDGLITNYVNSENAFVATENMLNTPQYRHLKGVFTGINNQSQTEQLMLVKDAANAAKGADGKVNSTKFAEYINDNGGQISADAATQMVKSLNNPNIRTSFDNFLDAAEPAYNNLVLNKVAVQEAVRQADTNLQVNWNKVAKDNFYESADQARQAFYNGMIHPSRMKKYLPQEVETASVVTISYNPDMEPYYESLRNVVGASLGTYVANNIMSLTKDQLASIGYDSKGNYVGDKPNPIQQINVGTQTINGKKQKVYIIKGHYGDKSVVLKPDQLGSQFNRDFMLGEASQTLNPDNWGEVLNPQVFNDVSATYFDDVVPNNITISNVKAGINTGQKIGSFYEPVGQQKINVKVVKGNNGANVLLGISQEAERLLESKYKTGSSYNIDGFRRDNSDNMLIEAIDILGTDDNSILDAITRLKAGYGKPIIQNELIRHPDRLKTSKPNLTGIAPLLFGSN